MQPLIGDLRQMVSRLEEERRIREEQSVPWTPETLRRWLRESLRDDEVIEYLATFLRNLKPLEQADR